MEEFMAATFDQAGFNVVLTPGSGDFGVDLIATKSGIGSIKILGSVKAYRRDHLVGYDAVRSLMGVVAAEPTASKGIIITTSRFGPRVLQDKYIARHVPTRLELMDGATLQKWLSELLESKGL
jgi:restriction system protein